MGLVGERALYGQGCMKGALEVILQGETTTKRKKKQAKQIITCIDVVALSVENK